MTSAIDVTRLVSAPHVIRVKAMAHYPGTAARELPVIDGTVDAATTNRVRRTCQLTLAPAGLEPITGVAPVEPYGTVVTVWRNVILPDGTEREFEVFSGRLDVVERATRVATQVRASDLAAAVVDARFEQPRQPPKGQLITSVMTAMIREAVGANTVVEVQGSFTATIASNTAVWERDRGQVLDQLAQSIGAEWYHASGILDGQVKFVIRPVPALGGVPQWRLGPGAQGTLVTEKGVQDRSGVFNAVVVTGEPTDLPPVRVVEYDTSPASPTRYGGPFGKVPRFYASPFIYNATQARQAALSMLDKARGLARLRSVEIVPNPAMQIGDVIDLTLPDLSTEQHIVDAYALPLSVGGVMRLSNRSTVEGPE